MHKLTFFAVQLKKNYHASAITCLQHCLVFVVQINLHLLNLAVGSIGNSNYAIFAMHECLSIKKNSIDVLVIRKR